MPVNLAIYFESSLWYLQHMQDNLIAVLDNNCNLIVKVKIVQEQMF